MKEVYMIFGMVVVTFGIRYVLFPFSGRIQLTENFKRALKFVPPTVLTAIIIPMMMMPEGTTIQLSWKNSYLIATLVTALVGWFGKNLLITILAGMAFFMGWQWMITQL